MARHRKPLDDLWPVRIRFSRVRVPQPLRAAMKAAGLRPRGRYEWLGRIRPDLLDVLGHDAEHAQGSLELRGERTGDPTPPEDAPDAPASDPGMSHAELRRWRLDAAQRAALAPPGEDLLEVAATAYVRRFGNGLPYLFGHPEPQTAGRMLLDAVERGEPVGGWELMRACGVSRPPIGSCY